MLEVSLWWTSILSRGVLKYFQSLHATGTRDHGRRPLGQLGTYTYYSQLLTLFPHYNQLMNFVILIYRDMSVTECTNLFCEVNIFIVINLSEKRMHEFIFMHRTTFFALHLNYVRSQTKQRPWSMHLYTKWLFWSFLSLYVTKNNFCLFEKPLKIQRNGVFFLKYLFPF